MVDRLTKGPPAHWGALYGEFVAKGFAIQAEDFGITLSPVSSKALSQRCDRIEKWGMIPLCRSLGSSAIRFRGAFDEIAAVTIRLCIFHSVCFSASRHRLVTKRRMTRRPAPAKIRLLPWCVSCRAIFGTVDDRLPLECHRRVSYDVRLNR
jgi:hypothetical protein